MWKTTFDSLHKEGHRYHVTTFPGFLLFWFHRSTVCSMIPALILYGFTHTVFRT